MTSASSHSFKIPRALAAGLCCTLLLTGCFREATPTHPETTETAVTADLHTFSPIVTEPPETLTETSAVQTEPPAAEIDPETYFENSLFIGDSVLEGIAKYVRAQRNRGEKTLSDAKFVTDLSGIRVADLVGDVTDGRILYTYKGKQQELDRIIPDAKPDRIFLMLGMNDLSWGYTVEETVGRYERLLDRLTKDFPDIPLVVMTVTPKIDSQYLPWYCRNPDFGSALLNSLSAELIRLCGEKKIACADVNAAVRDEKGNLPADFCNDGYVHLSDAGAAVLVEALENFAVQELSNP